MAGNRKNQSPVIRFVPVLKTLFLCLFIGGSGVGYVWQRNQIYELSQEITQLEMKFDQLRRQNKTLSGQLAKLCSPVELDARVRRANLGLALPQQDQVLRLVEPPGEERPDQAAGRYAIR